MGGYLVCLGNEVILGQAHPGNPIDLPIQADISRRQAKIRRAGEGYVLEPLGSEKSPGAGSAGTGHSRVSVEGQVITAPTLLSDGDELELGAGVKLRFRKPHALSASARLEMISGHRTHPFADGVILMAESCVLGPRWQNHIVCREWNDDLVLYRQEEELYCRAVQPLEIDGQSHAGRGRIAFNSRIVGSDFSLSLEQIV